MNKNSDDKEKMHAIRHALQERHILIAWKPEYDLGISILDEQHRGIVTAINSFYFSMQNRRGVNMLSPVIGMVNDYARIHFEAEEEFHAKCGFPDAKNHHALHLELIDSTARIQKQSMENRDPQQLMHFLKDWWINHICDKDRVFHDYLVKMSRHG